MSISYIGGKASIAKPLIIPNIPTDIETFVEIFGGMYWVFFKMNLSDYPNLKTVVYNDFNRLNSNLFKCLNDHKTLLEECLKLPTQQKGVYPTPYICKETFNKIKSEIYNKDFVLLDEPDYRIAASYAYVLTQVFSGLHPEKANFIDLKGKYHSKFTSFINKLNSPKWQEMYERIDFVENMDFEDVINKYDSKNTFFYADPPYHKTENYYSSHDFTESTHMRLSRILNNIEGRFSLSYYDFPELSQMFPKEKFKWVSKEFFKPSMARSGKSQSKGEELLIMNYEL